MKVIIGKGIDNGQDENISVVAVKVSALFS
jgi:hypothetical protein